MAFSPMPPVPKTARLEPALTRAVLITAPAPVVTAQPIKAALYRGMSSRIFTALFSGTNDHLRCIRRTRDMLDVLTTNMNTRGAVIHVATWRSPFAQLRSPSDTVATPPARRRPRQDHMVSNGE